MPIHALVENPGIWTFPWDVLQIVLLVAAVAFAVLAMFALYGKWPATAIVALVLTTGILMWGHLQSAALEGEHRDRFVAWLGSEYGLAVPPGTTSHAGSGRAVTIEALGSEGSTTVTIMGDQHDDLIVLDTDGKLIPPG